MSQRTYGKVTVTDRATQAVMVTVPSGSFENRAGQVTVRDASGAVVGVYEELEVTVAASALASAPVKMDTN